jgi:hypothetical protein
MSIITAIHVNFQNVTIQNMSQTVKNLQKYAYKITYLFKDK